MLNWCLQNRVIRVSRVAVYLQKLNSLSQRLWPREEFSLMLEGTRQEYVLMVFGSIRPPRIFVYSIEQG